MKKITVKFMKENKKFFLINSTCFQVLYIAHDKLFFYSLNRQRFIRTLSDVPSINVLKNHFIPVSIDYIKGLIYFSKTI